MTQFYILTEDDEEVRELSFGRVPERIKEMCHTLLDWETEERLRARAAEPVRLAKRKKRRSA